MTIPVIFYLQIGIGAMIASRLLSILLKLQRGPITARMLADAFEVSPRTIYRDIDQLAYAGIPVYCERGRGGGIFLDKAWSNRSFGLTMPEIEALLTAGDNDLLDDLGLNLPLTDAQRKLVMTLPEQTQQEGPARATRILIDPVAWYRRRDRPEHLAFIASAMWNAQQLHIAYASWAREVERTVDPLGIVLKAGVWYLIGSCEGTKRTYRINQISAARVTGKPAVVPKDFDLAQHWNASLARFEQGLHQDTARIQITAEGLRRLDRMGEHVTAAARASLRQTGQAGWMSAVIPIESIENATFELLALGSHARITAPDELKESVLREARLLLETA